MALLCIFSSVHTVAKSYQTNVTMCLHQSITYLLNPIASFMLNLKSKRTFYSTDDYP